MVRELRGRRMIVTGASSGIGRCLAEQAAGEGARIILAARSTDALGQLADSLNGRNSEVIPVTADVTKETDRQRLLQVALDRLGGLDVLINNAGVASFGHFATSSEPILRQIMEVNFFAPAELIRSAIPILVKGNQPAIVNIASMCGRRGLPAWTEYSASKFALCGLTEALRGEMARFDIDVLLMVPGLTQSDLPRHLLRNDGRMKIDFQGGMAPKDVAAAVLKALRNNRTETILGREARWMLRVNRFFPRWVDRLIARRVDKLYKKPRVEFSQPSLPEPRA
jgi:short-subunit dehydrogenase